MDTNIKKKIDWTKFQRSCPKCASIKIKRMNIFKREYKEIRGVTKLIELELFKCKKCENEFWGSKIWI